jgi:large subunit ribosomal protein L23
MILKYPFVTEKATMILEHEGKLLFLVRKEANKDQIRKAIEATFDKEVTSVRTMMTMKGEKKAIVSFAGEKDAEEILSRLGIM